MLTPFPSIRLALRRALCIVLSGAQVWAYAGPAQKPLLTASEGPKPNVVLTLDDSGSMNWHMMPTEIGATVLYTASQGPIIGTVTTYTRRSGFLVPRRCASLPSPIVVPPATAPTDTACYTNSVDNVYGPSVYTPGTQLYQLEPKIHPDDDDGNGRNTSGIVDTNATGINGVANIYAARFRSADTNGSYYNPATTYVPWPASARNIPNTLVDADGYPLNYSQTPLYPTGKDSRGQASNATVNLVTALANSSNRWCASGMTDLDGNNDTCQTESRNFQPAVYFKRTSGDGTSYSHFERTDINQISDSVQKAKELKNFAVWFTYYRNRLLTAKGAVALAFDRQKDNAFRLGYGSINNGRSTDNRGNAVYTNTTIDGFSSFSLERGVRPFSNQTGAADGTYNNVKSSFLNWLVGLKANGGTPLRTAMQDIGEYYSSTSSSGDPYRTKPTVGTEAPLSCRRSYHILVTDGYWNDAAPSIGDQDGTAGSQITGPNNTDYTYAAAAPFSSTTAASNTLADVAMKYWKNDIRQQTNMPNNIVVSADANTNRADANKNPAFWQHMVNFTVGLGVDGTLATKDSNGRAIDANSINNWPAPTADASTTIDDLWHAAVNSRGKYLKATDPIAFANELGRILSSITSTGGTLSGVAISRTSLVSGALKLVPSFEPDSWSGELVGTTLDGTGKAQSTPAPWYASRKLPAFGKRNLWTGGTSTGVGEFKSANLTADDLPLGHLTTSASAGVAPTNQATLVNYLRGDTSNETGNSTSYRPRKSVIEGGITHTNVLGSFINSLPVYIKGADFGHIFLPAEVNGKKTGRSTYSKFLSDKRKRSGLVLIGGNDGMLHGFRDTDGVEMFGYIPRTVLKGDSHPNTTSSSNLFGVARLADPNYEHQFFMDGQINEGDISACTTDGCTWKNLAVASAGGGAKSIVALNVTPNFSADPAEQPVVFGQSNVLWELDKNNSDSDIASNLGFVMSGFEIGMMPNGEWAVIFGNGYDSTDGRAVLFIVKASDGTLIRAIKAGTETNNGLGGVRVVRSINNIITQAYAGDLQGNVWKFDLSDADQSKWDVDFGKQAMFTALQGTTPQPITAAPNYVSHPKGGLMLIVPTGKLYSTTDTSVNTQQTIYGLWDKAAIGNLSAAADVISPDKLLTQVVQVNNEATKSTTALFNIVADSGNSAITDSRGWKLNMLFGDGERGIYTPQFLRNFAYVETVQPGKLEGESCSVSEGSGYGYLLNPFTGAESTQSILDLSGDGSLGTGDKFGVFKRPSIGRSAIQTDSADGKGGALQCVGNQCPKQIAPDTSPYNRHWRQIFWTIR